MPRSVTSQRKREGGRPCEGRFRTAVFCAVFQSVNEANFSKTAGNRFNLSLTSPGKNCSLGRKRLARPVTSTYSIELSEARAFLVSTSNRLPSSKSTRTWPEDEATARPTPGTCTRVVVEAAAEDGRSCNRSRNDAWRDVDSFPRSLRREPEVVENPRRESASLSPPAVVEDVVSAGSRW